MRKIMLVIDDYREMVTLESCLRRVGLDVLSLGKDVLVNDALLRFTPDIFLVSGRGRNVDGFRLAARMRKSMPLTRIGLVLPTDQIQPLPPEIKQVIDAIIDSPVQPGNVITIVAKLSGLDPTPLLGKYEKLTGQKLEASNDSKMVHLKSVAPEKETSVFVQNTGNANEGWDPVRNPGTADIARSSRSDRYAKFLQEHGDEPVDRVLPREPATAAMEQLKQVALAEKPDLDRIETDKRKFAEALFKEVPKVKSRK